MFGFAVMIFSELQLLLAEDGTLNLIFAALVLVGLSVCTYFVVDPMIAQITAVPAPAPVPPPNRRERRAFAAAQRRSSRSRSPPRYDPRYTAEDIAYWTNRPSDLNEDAAYWVKRWSIPLEQRSPPWGSASWYDPPSHDRPLPTGSRGLRIPVSPVPLAPQGARSVDNETRSPSPPPTPVVAAAAGLAPDVVSSRVNLDEPPQLPQSLPTAAEGAGVAPVPASTDGMVSQVVDPLLHRPLGASVPADAGVAPVPATTVELERPNGEPQACHPFFRRTYPTFNGVPVLSRQEAIAAGITSPHPLFTWPSSPPTASSGSVLSSGHPPHPFSSFGVPPPPPPPPPAPAPVSAPAPFSFGPLFLSPDSAPPAPAPRTRTRTRGRAGPAARPQRPLPAPRPAPAPVVPAVPAPAVPAPAPVPVPAPAPVPATPSSDSVQGVYPMANQDWMIPADKLLALDISAWGMSEDELMGWVVPDGTITAKKFRREAEEKAARQDALTMARRYGQIAVNFKKTAVLLRLQLLRGPDRLPPIRTFGLLQNMLATAASSFKELAKVNPDFDSSADFSAFKNALRFFLNHVVDGQGKVVEAWVLAARGVDSLVQVHAMVQNTRVLGETLGVRPKRPTRG